MKKKWYQTRKFWLAVGSVISIIASEACGIELEPETIASIAAIVIAWIWRQSVIDTLKGE